MADTKEAVDFLRHVSDVESTNRTEGLDDLKFRFGEQWPVEIQNSRNLESRPCLTINEVDSFCRQVENQQRQQRPRIKIHAVDNRADPKIAKVIQGLCRHVEVNSDADQAYDTAFKFACTIGWGYMRMRTDYIRESSFDQDIYIDQIENPFTVYFDTGSTLPDGADAEKALITDQMQKEAFQKQYPGAEIKSFTEIGAGDNAIDWITEKEIRLAEYYYADRKATDLIKLSDGTVAYADEMPPVALMEQAGIQIAGTRKSFKRIIRWCKQTAFEVLEEKVIPGRWIPIIPVYGQSYIVNGKRIRFGLVRFSKDPQRMVNYWETAATEALALAPKAKWLLAAGQDDGFENEWAQANVSAKAILHYNQRDAEGQPAGKPDRIQPEAPPAGFVQATMMASQNLKRVLGMYDPAVTARSMHKSASTINAEDQQTDQSNFHYYDNLTRSIKHVGRIILDWAPKIWDTERVMRIIGDDERPDLIVINEKAQHPDNPAVTRVLNDMTVGTYDVVMDTGPGYNSKRQEAVAVFTNMLVTPLGQKIAAVADDVVVRNLDVPGADVIADRLAAANPLAKVDEKSDVPPQAQMAIAQLQAQLQKMQQVIQQMGLELKFKTGIEQMRQEGETRRMLMKETAHTHDVELRAATNRHDTEVKAFTAQNVEEIRGMVALLAKKLDIAQFEREVEKEEDEQIKKMNEQEPIH